MASALRRLAPEDEVGCPVTLEALRSPVWLFDPDRRRMLWANRAACALWGAEDRAALLARDIDASLSDATRNRLALCRQAVERGEALRESWSFTVAGRTVTVDCLCSAWPVDGGTALLLEGRPAGESPAPNPAPADTDDEDSRARLDAILASAPVGIAIVDAERRLRRVNEAMAGIVRQPLEVLKDASTRILYGDDAAYDDIGRRAYPVMRNGDVFEDSVPMHRPDSGEVWCRLIGRQIHADDPAAGYVWIVEDITVRRRAEQMLNDRIAFQRVLLDTVPVPIFVQDVSGYYLNANKAFEQWMGIDRTSLFGKTTAELTPPSVAERDGEADRTLLADGQPQTFEAHFRSADGSLRDVVVSKALYTRNGDKPAGIVGTMTDISERKRAEQALSERHALFEQIFVASGAIKLLIDPGDGHIVDANPVAADFYGYPLDRLRGLPADSIGFAMDATAGAGGHARHHIGRHRLASGETRDVEVYSSRLPVNGRTLLLLLVYDITERRRAEDALRRKTAELERSNAELEAFAYVASHDLRQPLRVVNSYLSLLERALEGKLDVETAEFVAFARDGAQRMDRLIVDLLEYSRVGRRVQTFRPVPLDGVVETALRNLEVAIAEAGDEGGNGAGNGNGGGADIAVDGALPTVSGDDNELVRLFQNLIGNAVKYRTPDRAPVVRIAAVPGTGADRDHWVFSVRDNGIGIPADQCQRIFGIFQRLHRRDEYEGTGVGLAVCKKIVEHHGGRIWVDSEPGAGSTFRFTLPAVNGAAVNGAAANGGGA